MTTEPNSAVAPPTSAERRERGADGATMSAKTQHEKTAGVDDARMQQRRHGRRRLHHLEQPAMQRQLRRFQERRRTMRMPASEREPRTGGVLAGACEKSGKSSVPKLDQS